MKKNMIRTSTTTFFDNYFPINPELLSKDYLAICPQVQQGLQRMCPWNITKKQNTDLLQLVKSPREQLMMIHQIGFEQMSYIK